MHWYEPEIDLFDSIEIYPYNQDDIVDLYFFYHWKPGPPALRAAGSTLRGEVP